MRFRTPAGLELSWPHGQLWGPAKVQGEHEQGFPTSNGEKRGLKAPEQQQGAHLPISTVLAEAPASTSGWAGAAEGSDHCISEERVWQVLE